MKVIIGVENVPRMQLTIDVDDTDNMPDLIALKDGQLLRLVGKYASPGETFSYRHINQTLHYYGEIKDWSQYTKLTG